MAARSCPSCGQPIRPEFRLCPYCGARLSTPILASGPAPVRARWTRARAATFVGLATVILALTAYIVIVEKDLTALVFGGLIVLLLYVTLTATFPRVSWPRP